MVFVLVDIVYRFVLEIRSLLGTVHQGTPWGGYCPPWPDTGRSRVECIPLALGTGGMVGMEVTIECKGETGLEVT